MWKWIATNLIVECKCGILGIFPHGFPQLDKCSPNNYYNINKKIPIHRLIPTSVPLKTLRKHEDSFCLEFCFSNNQFQHSWKNCGQIEIPRESEAEPKNENR